MRTASLVAIAGLAAFVTYCLNRGENLKSAKHQVKQDLNRWEDEGGNVPAVATPSPSPAPAQNLPGANADLRH
jgi:hypothetical protein